MIELSKKAGNHVDGFGKHRPGFHIGWNIELEILWSIQDYKSTAHIDAELFR